MNNLQKIKQMNIACPICRECNLKRTRAAYHAKSKSTAAEKEVE